MTAPPDPSIGGFTLDAGALIALEAADERVRTLLAWAESAALPVGIPAGALAQVWRGGSRQARLARLLKRPGTEVVPLDLDEARSVGRLCARAGHPDIVDGSVALCASERGHAVLTSDPEDIRALNPSLRIIPV